MNNVLMKTKHKKVNKEFEVSLRFSFCLENEG